MKKIFILLIILLVFPLSGCNNKKSEQTKEPISSSGQTDVEKFKNEYEKLNPSEGKMGITVNIDDDSNINYLTMEESINFLKNDTGIIYFGYPSCPWCRNIVPVLLDVSKENNMVVNYVDVSIQEGNDDFYNQLLILLDEYLMADNSGNKALYVPDVYFVKNGEIKNHHLGSISTQTNPYIPLQEDQMNELKTIYNGFIDQIKGVKK